MKRKHIAVFTYMADGHVNSYLDVCSELVGRGNRVTFPTSAKFANRIREAGVEAVELKTKNWCFPKKLLTYESSDDTSYWRQFGSVSCPSIVVNALSTVGELEEFYATDPPDVILYDWFNIAGRIFAKDLGRPGILMCSHFAHPRSIVRLGGDCTFPQPVLEFSPVLDNLMSEFGIEGEGQMWHAEPINIFLIPGEFQYDVESFDSRFRFVGVTFSRRSDKRSLQDVSNHGKPILLISEGSTSRDDRFLNLCIDAFAESRYHVVFLKGVYNSEVRAPVLPNNFQVMMDVSNREILPLANVAVCQAGMGTTLECLYHGVPPVAVPLIPPNVDVAQRIDELGLGMHVPKRSMTPLVLRSAVDAASMTESLRTRVMRMQDNLRSNRGAELAANAIEEWL